MHKLHALWGDRVEFVEVMIRQAHPGPGAPTYHSFERKMQDAETWQRDEDVPYTVVVDDLEGTVHQVYGGLADPTYVLDADGRVAFYSMWTHAPTLHEALEELEREGSGVVRGGMDRTPHLGAAMTDGWRGLRKGAPQSIIEIETSFPTSALGPWLGYQMRPLLAPLTLRAEPLPTQTKVALTAGALVLLALGVQRWRRSRDEG